MKANFDVLGTVRIVADQAAIPLRPMEQRVLALLLVHAGTSVSADWLIDQLWFDGAPKSSRTALRVHVTRLRSAMRSVGLNRLASDQLGYRIHVEPGEYDAEVLSGGLARASLLDEEPATAAAVLRDASGRWRGRPFEGLDGIPALMEARAVIERRHEETLVALAEAELAAGRHARLRLDIDGWCNDHPYNEALAAALVLCRYRNADQVGALEAARSFRRRLVDDLGIEPGPSFRELGRAVLRQAPELLAAPAPAADAGSVVSVLGLHGRDRVLSSATASVRAGGGVVAIHGPRGSGRSAVLHRLAQLNGLVEVNASSEPLGPQLIRSLGLPMEAFVHGPEDAALSVAESLTSAGRRGLAVDDVDRADPDAIALLLCLTRLAPGVALVTTSPAFDAASNPLLASPDVVSAATSLELPPLDARSARALLVDLLAAAEHTAEQIDALVEAGGGNPLHLASLARHFCAGGDPAAVPASTREYIHLVLTELGTSATQLIRVASLDPVPTVDLGLISEVLGVDVETLLDEADRLVALGILSDVGEGLTFRHNLVKEAVREGLSPARRARLHAQIGSHLVDHQRPDPVRVAHHLRAGRPTIPVDLAAHWTALEARQCVATGRIHAAESAFCSAISLGQEGSVPASELREWRLELCAVLPGLGRLGRSQDVGLEVAVDARRDNDASHFARAAVAVAGPWHPLGDGLVLARALTTEAVAWLPQGAPGRAALIEAYVRVHEGDDNLAWAARVSPLTAELDEVVAGGSSASDVAVALRGLHNLSWRGSDAARRVKLSRDLVDVARRSRDRALAFEASRAAFRDNLELGDLRAADEIVVRLEGDIDSAPPLHRWWSAILRRTLCQLRGDLPGARRADRRANDNAAAIDPDLLAITDLEARLAAAIASGAPAEWESLAEDLSDETLDEPMLALAAAAIGRSNGRSNAVGPIEEWWASTQSGPRTVPGCALAVLALPSGPDADRLGGRIRSVLASYPNGFVTASGAASLGTVASYCALLDERRSPR